MKIGVFGDSYAAAFKENYYFAWFNLLAKKLGGEVIDHNGNKNLGISWGGRPTYKSYKLFLKYYKNYDFNIFIAGDPFRYTKPYLASGNEFWISNFNTVEPSLKAGWIDQKEADLLTGWFMKSDYDFLADMQELILQDIERHDPKVYIIPSQIETSFTKKRMEQSNMNFGLTQLFTAQLKYLNSPKDFWPKKEPINKISCHFTHETNEWLANALYDNLIHQKKLEIPDNIPHKHDYRYVFEEQ